MGNRNTNNTKTEVENAISAEKNMRYAHFAEKCGKKAKYAEIT